MLKKSKNGALSGRFRTVLCALAIAGACAGGSIGGALIAGPLQAEAADKEDKPIILRVCNWEEYIDLGDWDEEETIELDSGDIIGENSMVEDFEEWYEETYGRQVKVEYSTFGTNEDLYNMLTLGDEYDLVCPSGQTVPLSDHFFDPSDENNYYIKGVSPYIKRVFDEHEIEGEPWSRYAAGYMWGVTGIVYNPEIVTREEASTWKILDNPKFNRQVTIKDNVRDSYFAAVGALKADLLTSEEFRNDSDYARKLEEEMNDTSPEMIAKVQDYLQEVKDNVYSFETDSGKADMITGKVVANYQWSGDGVYSLDQAAEDDFDLAFAVPEESTNIYFDGWVMLKNGIRDDADKQHAAEAFINFNSRPDNVVRNMYYIGYTSVISGGDDPTVFEYADYNYSAEEYVIEASPDMLERQLYAAYPPDDVMRRSSIMTCFDEEQTAAINQMWINVRCYNIKKVPWWGWIIAAAVAAATCYLAWIRIKAARRKS